MTSSARASIDGGIVRPRALAVFSRVEDWRGTRRPVSSPRRIKPGVPIIHGFRQGPQSGSPGDVSSALPKIPDVEFSPVRLQAAACLHQPCPARTATEVKRQVRVPSGAPWFGMAFVACVPPADSAGPCPVPSPPRAQPATTSTHGSVAPGRLCCPPPPRYHDPMRGSRRLPRTSQGSPGYTRDLARRLGLGCHRDRPPLSHSLLSACQCLYAGGIDGCTGPDPSPSSSPSPSKGGLGSLILLSLAF